MQRLRKNVNRYCGDPIDIDATLADIRAAAARHGFAEEVFFSGADPQVDLIAFRRSPADGKATKRVYLSSGIHGDEPAGPLAMRQLLQENLWPASLELWICPCLNPAGFKLNCRENGNGVDLNREYRAPRAAEILAHIAWLDRQPQFDLCLLLHEDWESDGFYLYEQNPECRPCPAKEIIERVSSVCPIDRSELIEGRPARDGIVRANIDPNERPDWPEAFYLITRKTRLSYTLEAPSDYLMEVRVAALVKAVNAAVEMIAAA